MAKRVVNSAAVVEGTRFALRQCFGGNKLKTRSISNCAARCWICERHLHRINNARSNLEVKDVLITLHEEVTLDEKPKTSGERIAMGSLGEVSVEMISSRCSGNQRPPRHIKHMFPIRSK